MKLLALGGAFGLGLSLAACSSLPIEANPDIGAAAKALSDRTATLQAAAKVETDSKVAVRRDEAIRYWLARGDDDTGININSANPRDSFARFVCAGTGALNNANAQIAYFTAYASAAQASVDPGPDTFAGQFAKFVDRNDSKTTIVLPITNQKAAAAFATCVQKVATLLEIYDRGQAASDTSDEFSIDSISPLITAGQALITSLENLAKDGLKIVNSIQARDHLKRFLNDNEGNLNTVEAAFLAKGQLDDAWNRRAAFVVGSAYDKFATLVADRNRVADRAKLRAQGLEVSNALSAYDALAKTKTPSEVSRQWISEVKTLKAAVNDDRVSITAIISYAQSVASEAKSVRADYADANTKFQALVKELAAAKKQ